MLHFSRNACYVCMTRVLNQLLNWRSLPSKTSFSKAQLLDTTGYFLLSSYKNPMSWSIPLNLFHLASWFLLLNPTFKGPHNIPVLFLFILFPMPILFSSFYINTSFSTSTSDFPAFYHSPLITDNHMLWSVSTSYFSFFLHISPTEISFLLLNTTSSHI